MNTLQYKSPHKTKSKIDQLINLGKEEDGVRSSSEIKDQDLDQLRMPSKYATVFTCSFERNHKADQNVKIFP